MLVSQAQYFSMKVFRNTEGTRFLLVNRYFGNGGSIDGKSMTPYPAAPTVNSDVFDKVIYVDSAAKPPCCLKIKNLTSDKASITPSVGEKGTFNGSIFANYSVGWSLSIVDRLFTGSGTMASVAWDGKNAAGSIVTSGTYSANLTAQTSEVVCTDGISTSVTVINDTCIDNDGDGYFGMSSTCSTGDDCNDNDATIHPGATELCDGKDNNCNGQVDEPKYQDADGDGFPIQVEGCPVPGIYDCNDNDAKTYPSAPEICGDLKDNNCNGAIDESCKRDRCMEVPM
ncbi:putative metal-binding motif-containing protein [Geobacter sp.]|uniref:putative metal-binding motif-containing protein n=1 Tax=Geobacter sp. TaxID=46610 RepID=UPI002630E8F7|nr:putative metal-binding motif-containing protein [Geobacter sp.]